MCGLAGALSAWLSAGEVEVFQHLAIMTTFRGKIGAGAVVVPVKQHKEIQIYRTVETLAHTVTDWEFCRNVQSSDKKKRVSCIMAHARQPTMGGWELEDTHPHISGDIIGMHNGTMKEIAGRVLKKDDNDSKLFFEDISENGIELAVKKAKGAYALTWIDKRAGTINFLRNAERPLYFGHYKDDTGLLYWASEAGMLHYVLNREKVMPTDEVVIKACPEDLLISFPIRPSGDLKPHARTVKNYSTSTSVPVVKSTTMLLPPPVDKVPASSDPEIPFPPMSRVSQEPPTFLQEEYEGEILRETKYNAWVTETDLKRILAKGCAGCDAPMSIADYWAVNPSRIIWYKKNEFLCTKCFDNPELKGYALNEMGVKLP